MLSPFALVDAALASKIQPESSPGPKVVGNGMVAGLREGHLPTAWLSENVLRQGGATVFSGQSVTGCP